MKNLKILSIQHGYLLKKTFITENLFQVVSSFKDLLQTCVSVPIRVELQRFNLSDILFRLVWNEFSINVSTKRVDFFFMAKYAPDNEKNFSQLLREMRSIMSVLFSTLNNQYGVTRLGLVVNYMLVEEKMTPVQRINEILLNNQLKQKKFTIYSLEGQESVLWKGYSLADVKRVWDAKYTSLGKKPVLNLGILRDINVVLQDRRFTDEDYNEFIQFVEPLFSCESIQALVS